MSFQIIALPAEQFSHLFGKDAETLANLGVHRIVADTKPGYPCRVSLQDAEIGESALLMNYEHQPAATPFRSSHAIFVREWAKETRPEVGEVPTFLRSRLLSVRAFDRSGMMLDADVVEGPNLEPVIDKMFANDEVDYVHLHNAKLGCYAAKCVRVE